MERKLHIHVEYVSEHSGVDVQYHRLLVLSMMVRRGT